MSFGLMSFGLLSFGLMLFGLLSVYPFLYSSLPPSFPYIPYFPIIPFLHSLIHSSSYPSSTPSIIRHHPLPPLPHSSPSTQVSFLYSSLPPYLSFSAYIPSFSISSLTLSHPSSSAHIPTLPILLSLFLSPFILPPSSILPYIPSVAVLYLADRVCTSIHQHLFCVKTVRFD